MSDKGLPQRFRHFYEHERWAHEAVLASLAGVPEARRSDPRFRKACDLFGHVVAARRLWLFRMGRTDRGATTEAELFRTGLGLAALGAECREVEALWTAYLEQLDHDEVGRVFTYTAFEGDRFENRVEEILVQLTAHSAYHRGQIAALVRELGSEPAVTDYLFWTRRPASGER